MEGKTTYLKDENDQEKYHYSYDYCFWSHNEFKFLENGYTIPQDEDSIYADQKFVYDKLGKEILDNAIKGYNCCLFAYGQTGSGKSYSIFGYGNNKGIVPMVCEQLIEGDYLKNDKIKSKISISMLEIYNEKIQDLLVQVKKRPQGGLKVRENNQLGVFVEGLQKFEVKTYNEIENIIESGNKNKSLGATLMNATSSRAHTIIILELIQKKEQLKKNTQKTSNIFLVDLAGSEKVGKTQAKGDRLKEACSINKSLSVLGQVIHQLYKNAIGKKTIVSYRDSVLTRILQNALGGNSKTTMICAISPARDNYEETLSTLRYANQAKMIKLNAQINESETDKLIRELTEENKRLKILLDKIKQNKNLVQEKDMIDIQDQIDQVQQNIDDNQEQDLNNIQHEKKRRASIKQVLSLKQFDTFDYTKVIHITNLNEDPMLSNKIYFSLEQYNNIYIGRTNKEQQLPNQIIINGVGIIQNHAIISYNQQDQEIYLKCLDIDAAQNTFVNGYDLLFYEQEIQNEGEVYIVKKLEDKDRIIFGTSTTFLLRIPQQDQNMNEAKINDQEINWEYCQGEKYQLQELPQREKLIKEYEEKKKELEENENQLKIKMEQENKKYEQMIKQKQEDFTIQMQQMQEELLKQSESFVQFEQDNMEYKNQQLLEQIEYQQKTKELEFQLKIQQLKKEAETLEKKKRINKKIEETLINFYPKIKEANDISNVLQRKISYHPYVDSLNLTQQNQNQNNNNQSEEFLIIKIKVINKEDGWVNYWTLDKFEERLELMREIIDTYFNYNIINYQYYSSNDPFWDPKEMILTARGICLIRNNIYRFSLDQKINFINNDGYLGYILALLEPVGDDGELLDELEMEEIVEEPEDLIDKNLSCNMKINFQTLILYDLNEFINKNISLSFSIMTGNGIETFYTPTYLIKDSQTILNFSIIIYIEKVTLDIIQYYNENNMDVMLYTEDLEIIQKLGKPAPPKLVVSKKRQIQQNDNYQTLEPNRRKGKMLRKSTIMEQYNQQGRKTNLCTIIQLTFEDKNQFLELISYLTTVEQLDDKQFRQIMNYNNNFSKTYVVEYEGKLIGTMKLVIDQKFSRGGGKVANFEDFVIHKDFRSKGLGSQLIQYAYEQAKQEGCYKLIGHCNEKLIGFYEKNNLETLGVAFGKYLQ